MFLRQALLGVVNRPDVTHVSLRHLYTSSFSLRDGLQRIGALWAEGRCGGEVLWDTGAGGEGGVGGVSFAVEVVDAVGGPGRGQLVAGGVGRVGSTVGVVAQMVVVLSSGVKL